MKVEETRGWGNREHGGIAEVEESRRNREGGGIAEVEESWRNREGGEITG